MENESKYSKYRVPQSVEIILDPNDPESCPGTVRIDGVPINNINEIYVETSKEDGNVGATDVTIKFRVPSQVFRLYAGTIEEKNDSFENDAFRKAVVDGVRELKSIVRENSQN